jgi:hypothetical protein
VHQVGLRELGAGLVDCEAGLVALQVQVVLRRHTGGGGAVRHKPNQITV